MESRQLLRLSQRLKLPAVLRHVEPLHSLVRTASITSSTKLPSALSRQAIPIGDYYASILSSSSPAITTAPPTSASPSLSNPPITSTDSEPSIIFSSRLSSPMERRSEIEKQSKMIAGVMVPPKPEEPDNCCMSGCVNCVWDRFRDEFEEWAVATKAAEVALRKETNADISKRKRKLGTEGGTGMMLGEGERDAQHTMISMDDDGGGSESNWSTSLDKDTDLNSEDLFANVPVGIREFMKQEKRLKEKHAREGTVG
ncbi:hypothetical protein BP6252_10083 [Coleophoma cylindrospora]|uniref:Oxidoreductase-like domain-containing protein n=1 Tax=Coleophoma cylindrospora TaxID=1849047 RepID=A0A3D8QXP1_9HELO|nr:hypothetical protein BP6252_10083 [Coleophoma cylindrospora]